MRRRKRERVLNLARGVMRIEVRCRYPERFLNVCAANRLAFWNVETEGELLRASFHVSALRRLRALSTEHGFAVTRLAKAGAPTFLRRVRRRYALLAGLLLCALGLRAAALFVWDIRVYGNETTPTGVLLRELDALGFRYGALGLSVDSERLANEMLLRVPELSWFAVNIRGSRADVLVRERRPKPELEDGLSPGVSVAAKAGVVTKVSVLHGVGVVRPGETVAVGDLLAAGRVTDRRGGTRDVRARAEVWARTWYELTAVAPLLVYEKCYTGDETTEYAVKIAGKINKLPFQGGNHTPDCDKIVTERALRLPGGVVLPVALVETRYAPYELVPVTRDAAGTAETLEAGLLSRLEATLDGTVTEYAFETAEEDGRVRVTLRAECLEQIAVTRDYTAEERTEAPTP
jgi:similar to stage IV sporulation protein